MHYKYEHKEILDLLRAIGELYDYNHFDIDIIYKDDGDYLRILNDEYSINLNSQRAIFEEFIEHVKK